MSSGKEMQKRKCAWILPKISTYETAETSHFKGPLKYKEVGKRSSIATNEWVPIIQEQLTVNESGLMNHTSILQLPITLVQ